MKPGSDDPKPREDIPSPAASSISLLVVEDSDADMAEIQRMLESSTQEFEITRASRVEEALQLMQLAAIHAVLLDLSLPPEGRGLDTLRRAQIAAAAVPIIVMTTTHDEKLALQAVRAGAQDYLVKGKWDAQLLVRTILYAVERHRMLLELQEARRHQQFLASHDRLTGLTNRSAFEESLQRTLRYAERHGTRVGLFFLDLDGFKAVNDGLGHAAGDEVLKKVADRLASSLRRSDLAARLGGDEFVVMIQDLGRGEQAARCARRLLGLLSGPMQIDGQEVRPATSIGIAMFPDDGGDTGELIRAADIAMYKAKSRGNNRYEFFSQALGDEVLHKLQLEASLRQALENREFVLHYQPIVAAATRRLVRTEALLRWSPPGRELQTADRFILVAEESGLIEPIGDWVLHAACQQWQAWRSHDLASVKIAVNLSARQLAKRGLVERIAGELAKAGMPPSCLELELTETTIMQESEAAAGVLEELHALGVGLSLDDFGTAYSSLSRLQAFPIDRVKIDRSFIREIPEDPDSVALTAAVIAMTHSLGLEVVAEGVETQEQLDVLVEQDCDEIQGHHFSPAVPPDEFTRWLS